MKPVDNNKTFSKMSAKVEAALQDVRDEESNLKMAKADLERTERDLAEMRAAFQEARDALFLEFPELAPAVSVAPPAPEAPVAPVAPPRPAPLPGAQGFKFRELDDDYMPS